MEDKNCRLLFEYLRSILYDSRVPQFDLDALDEPYRKLGRGLQYLEQAVRELKSSTAALSRGNLSAFAPSRDNPLCENLKNIHANLNHLTWQAKQVAKGDYSQTVSYLGEFSEAFNTMTAQLREREAVLKEEVRLEKEHAEMMENYNQLLLALMQRSKEDVLVTGIDPDVPHVFYSSRYLITEEQEQELYSIFRRKKRERAFRPGSIDDVHDWVWETEDSAQHYYRISTTRMEWQGQQAYAHIIMEITQEKIAQGKLELEAYYDSLTGIGNRYYFHKRVEELLKTGENLVFCCCDLDGLKYVNDTYGHQEGDNYLQSFVRLVKQQIRENDLFARTGGDEFCVVLNGCPTSIATAKMARVQAAMTAGAVEYPRSFSCGIVTVPKKHGDVDIPALLRRGDEAMYQQKKEHHKSRLPEMAEE